MRRVQDKDRYTEPSKDQAIAFSGCPAHRGEPKTGLSGPVCYFLGLSLRYDGDADLPIRLPNCPLVRESDLCLVSGAMLNELLETVEELVQVPDQPVRVEKRTRIRPAPPSLKRQRAVLRKAHKVSVEKKTKRKSA